MWKKVIFYISCAVLILNFAHWAIAEETAPVVAAQKWLKIVDQGQYEQSWDTAAAYFKSMASKGQWVSQVTAVRTSLGAVATRVLENNQRKSTLPGAPDGEYYVLSFKTVFVNKASAVETLTLMKDNDGQWRLAGYFIK